MRQVEINSQSMEEYRKQLEQLGASFDLVARRIVTQEANLGWKKVKQLTPVGKHPNPVEFTITRGEKAGKKVRFYTKIKLVGGTMRRGWEKMLTSKAGPKWVSGYANNVRYALYVNSGHAIKNTKSGPIKGYYPGQHMLEKSISYARKALPALFQDEINRLKRKTGF